MASQSSDWSLPSNDIFGTDDPRPARPIPHRESFVLLADSTLTALFKTLQDWVNA
jgi:hypothetical protein